MSDVVTQETRPPVLVPSAWSTEVAAVLQAAEVDPQRGLTAADVERRRRRWGANRLAEAHRERAWRILVRQFQSLIVLLLVVAGAAAFAFGQWMEGAAIAVVVVINGAIGFFTEIKAVRSMEALRELGTVSARVRRDGEVREVPADRLVPGDLVVLEAGDIVSADLRVLEAEKLQADESALTGESTPVSKRPAAVAEDSPLAERASMLFRGTSITRGAGETVVVATGMHTALGEIAALAETAEEERTPLERRLDRLGGRLVWATLGIAAFVTASGALSGKPVLLMIETGIALAVATVPEGLPIVATIALARGMWRMAKRNALINRLSAVETLGATNLICADKTGTLTENRMTVTTLALASGRIDLAASDDGERFTRDDADVDPDGDPVLRPALEIGALCNNARLGTEDAGAKGDPMEVALLAAAQRAGIDRHRLLDGAPEVREEPFDTDTKMMATFHEDDGGYRVAVKGAPEQVLAACTSILTDDGPRSLDDAERQAWLERNEALADDGLRVLALAHKQVDAVDARPYADLTFVGLAGLLDPPRREVRDAIAACKAAGIRVVMVTGDQAGTARKIGDELGLADDAGAPAMTGRELVAGDGASPPDAERLLSTTIFARVDPKQKLDLIALHQDAGAIVAMTGDGVNDAPALRKADIGVAMGRRGTQVAREAADMVLQDDAFSTIVAAVEHGRIIFANIRKFVFFLLSCNVSEVMVVGVASALPIPLPILPLQILFLNLVTDVFPALALGMGEGDEGVMERPPRDPREPVLTGGHWGAIVGYAVLLTVTVFAALGVAMLWWGLPERRAVTISFMTLAFAQLWHVFNMREPGTTPWRNDIVRNPYVWGALALCVGLLAVAMYVPFLAQVLDVAVLTLREWGLVLAASLVPLLVGQAVKARWKRGG